MNILKLKALAMVAFFFITTSAHSQVVRITVDGGRSFCGFNLRAGFYDITRPMKYITNKAQVGDDSGIADVVEEIKRILGVNVAIDVYIAKNEENCFASTGQNGSRMIIADHLFLNRVNKRSGTQWAAISIIAHEIGHHIAGFTRRSSELESELDADYWSGFALQKLGANKDASVKCIMVYGTERDTSSHPNKYSRSSTIRKGWDDAVNGSYDDDRCADCH